MKLQGNYGFILLTSDTTCQVTITDRDTATKYANDYWDGSSPLVYNVSVRDLPTWISRLQVHGSSDGAIRMGEW